MGLPPDEATRGEAKPARRFMAATRLRGRPCARRARSARAKELQFLPSALINIPRVVLQTKAHSVLGDQLNPLSPLPPHEGHCSTPH